MTDPDVAAFPCTGPEPVRRRLYRALAQAIDASRAPATAAFLTTIDPGDRWIVVRPAAVLDVVRAEPALAAGLAPVPMPAPSPAPPAGFAGRFGAAVGGAGELRRPASGDWIDVPPIGPLIGPQGWLAIQTFWAGGAGARLWAARRWWFASTLEEDLGRRFEAVASAVAHDWSVATGVTAIPARLRLGSARDWRRLGVASLPRAAWSTVGAERIEMTPEPRWGPGRPSGATGEGHGIVLGASGAGKSWYLADRAAAAIARGEPVVAIDLHGDLAPAIVARLDASGRGRTVGIDVGDRPFPGIAAIDPSAPPARAAAHLVAALKRLTPDGSELYWGFRLERIFDAFVRLVQESGGSLLDLHALLTDPDLRDAARLATRSPDLARFLEELVPVVRRTPDFLWSASARLAKVVATPALAELLAPRDGGLEVEELLARGRSVLIRIPFAHLGPESASFAATLVLARLYLGQAARARPTARPPPTTVVLDEVQALSPRLVAEMLAEGRKFGFRLLVATQFPERLAPELRATVGGVVREVVAFRIPRPGVEVVAGWLGLGPAEGDRWLTDLPPGYGLARSPEHPSIRPIAPSPVPGPEEAAAWGSTVASTRRVFAIEEPPDDRLGTDDPAGERILLAILAAEEAGRPIDRADLATAAERLPGPPIDPAQLDDRVAPLERQGFIGRCPDGVCLTAAGERRIGLGGATGASRESAEHRRLVVRAFRLFARHGHLLEIVRQGRFDTQLPDARYRQIPERLRHATPGALAVALDRMRDGWAWRFFGGLDVHVEAEVSGAVRPARIRHGVAKARSRGAFVLFLVSDARRARRVRATLRALGLGVDRAQVWTLPPYGRTDRETAPGSAIGPRAALGAPLRAPESVPGSG